MTLYEVLGVSPEAGAQELHEAYVALARRHHPDLAGGDADHMRAINEAWSVLGDPVRRARYDRGLQHGGRPGAPVPAHDAGSGYPRDDEGDRHGDLRADLEDDTPIGGIVVLPRWLSLVPVAMFALSGGFFCIGVLFAAPQVLALAVMAFLLSCLLFLAAPFMALLASRRANRS